MNPVNAMCILHRRFGKLAPYRGVAQRLAIMFVLIYLGASLSASLVGFSLNAPMDLEPVIAWISPPEVPQEWQWRGNVVGFDPTLRSSHPPSKLDWLLEIGSSW